MPGFPHLPLPKKISAPHRYRGIPVNIPVSPITINNLQNRVSHGRTLKRTADELARQWRTKLLERQNEDLPTLPSENIIPIFLQIDTNLFDPESLYSFGIEIIAEDETGYIIGASGDNFISLKEKIDKFIQEEGKYKNKASQLWQIILGDQWRLDYILSPELSEKWSEIRDGDVLIVDVSIACVVKIPSEPNRREDEGKREFNVRYQRWIAKKERLELERDELEAQRQTEFGNFINDIGGVILSDFVGYSDSFSCRVELNGKALKDMVLNYQYLFDVTEYNTLRYTSRLTDEEIIIDATINPPSEDSPKVCVIDSGIQEGHRLLNAGIDTASSKSYVPRNISTADEVAGGGHGTKVAGAVLYGTDIPKTGTYDLDLWVCNAKILNARNTLPKEVFPPRLMEEIISDFEVCKIFNLSVNSNRPGKIVHMSHWSTMIDKLMAKDDKLFVISSGNISVNTGNDQNPGIKEHIAARRSYPEYLFTKAARIADPAQSCFAITVGSICLSEYEDDDKKSFGIKDDPSSFTRTGPGMWRMLKPDVVEYGGDFIKEKIANPNISQLPETSVEVIKSTVGGGNAVGYDVGSSFAAPKVSHIAGRILKEIPDASANLLRTLIAQSARLPNEKFKRPQYSDIQFYGYGVPNLSRAIENSQKRITMIAEGEIAPKEAQIYTIKIPDNIRRPGNEYDILMEVSVAFMATPRRTRRRMNSYLSAWVDWQSSKFDESYNQFKNRITRYVEGDVVEDLLDESDSEEHIKWNIRENINWGTIKNLRRQDSSLQKDWTILKAYSLPEEFSIAIIGHKGWEKDILKKVPYSVAVSFEVLTPEIEVDIYNDIRIENEIEVEQQITI